MCDLGFDEKEDIQETGISTHTGLTMEELTLKFNPLHHKNGMGN